MTKVLLAAFVMLLACPGRAESHRLDEYLQATRLALTRDRVVLEIDLTPGVMVAPQIFALIDDDGNGRVSEPEIERYGQRVLRDLILELDDQRYPLTLARAECPSWSEVRNGTGAIRLEATVEAPLGAVGLHRLHYENRHQPTTGVYLVNALVPSTDAIVISGQRRDVMQHAIDLDIAVSAHYATAAWIVLPFVGVIGLLAYRRRVSVRA